MNFRPKKKYDLTPKSDEQGKPINKNRKALTIYLRHGDIVIQDGTIIQEYYEVGFLASDKHTDF